jgi:hypothetical protein
MDSWRRNCVSPVFLTPCVGSLTLIAFICLLIPVFPTTFVFNGFNETNIILEADASLIRSQSVLALTNQTRIMLGRALYSIPVQMKSNETLSSFSTTFVFSIVPPPLNQAGTEWPSLSRPTQLLWAVWHLSIWVCLTNQQRATIQSLVRSRVRYGPECGIQ